jgi:chromosome segregation ATPase
VRNGTNELSELKTILNQILEEQRKTNGRVTRLEEREREVRSVVEDLKRTLEKLDQVIEKIDSEALAEKAVRAEREKRMQWQTGLLMTIAAAIGGIAWELLKRLLV